MFHGTKLSFIRGLLGLVLISNVGCPDNKSSSAPSNPNPTATQCLVGQLFVPQYNGCFSTTQCPAGSGTAYVPQANQCLPGTAGGLPSNPTGAYSTKPKQVGIWEGQLVITNASVYQDLLRSWRICDQGTIFWTWDLGANNCSTWDDQAFLRFEVMSYNNSGLAIPGALARTTIGAINQLQWGGRRYALEYPQTPVADWLSPINADAGFEMQTAGAAGTPGFNDVLSTVGNTGRVIQSADGAAVMQYRLTLRFRKNGGQWSEFGRSDVRYVYGF